MGDAACRWRLVAHGIGKLSWGIRAAGSTRRNTSAKRLRLGAHASWRRFGGAKAQHRTAPTTRDRGVTGLM